MKLFFAVLGLVALIVVPFKLLVAITLVWLVVGMIHIGLTEDEPPSHYALCHRSPTTGETLRAWVWAPTFYISVVGVLGTLWWGYRVEEEITAEEYEEELADIRRERGAYAATLFGKALTE